MPDEDLHSPPTELTSEAIDQLVLAEYPYPIAANYRRVLEAKDWEKRTRECIRVFEYGVRAITLGILSQYLIRDRDEFSDPALNRELYKKKLTNISLGKWVEYLFLSLKAYSGRRERFFMQELYDLYWDPSHIPHQPQKGVRVPFSRLVEIRNIIEHKAPPKNEDGWKKLGMEALHDLREIMRNFRFLQNYDLIRVVNPQRGEYERYTGENITLHQENVKSEQKIQPGWFYLSRQDHTLLELHPLLIFWTSSEDKDWTGVKISEKQDVAVFDALLKDAVGYIATVVREVIQEHDATLISQLRNLIEYTRQQVTLSWDALREAARQFSSEEMEGVRKKYYQALYLQRRSIYEKFQDFLMSDKTCFVLTGKSGVGKSNFVLSLTDTLSANRQVTVLIYNAARLLDVASTSLKEMIRQDLSKLIKLGDDTSQDIFALLDKSEIMAGRQLIVVLDGINENTNPRAILQKLDQMVGSERYTWLKVLITSRPEGWRSMKRGLPLAEDRYYREKGTDDVSIEIQEFTIKLDIFERDELQAAYNKYRGFFNLQTEYSALIPAVRNALRDPLVLRLVGEIFKGKLIPNHIQVNEIYKLYIDHLLTAEPARLYQQDIILLEQELMPMMLRHHFYENKLTASQVQTARTKDGRPLWELIHNYDPIGSDQKVNDSYVRLRDTELLDESGSGMDYVISFKYERFYEFFGGRRLYQAAREQTASIWSQNENKVLSA